ncbi:MAG: NAD(P)-dependent oxidoreductase [Dehalococcoidia bacterium]
MKVGFIGTGNIGNPMARNVLKAGHMMTVFDLRESAAANLIELGAAWAPSAAAVAAQSEVVLTSLPGPVEIEQALTGRDGILDGARQGLVYFDLSTNAPAVARRLALVAAERGVTYLDAPVSGGIPGAERATLAVMVGGDRAAFDAYRPVLDAIGSNVFHLGGVGNGCTAKLVNNLVSLATRHLINEALVAGVKAGLDGRTLYEVMAVSSASPHVPGVPALLARGFTNPTFTLRLATKDVGLAVTMGRDYGVPMPMAAAAEQAMLAAVAAGHGEEAVFSTIPGDRTAGRRAGRGPRRGRLTSLRGAVTRRRVVRQRRRRRTMLRGGQRLGPRRTRGPCDRSRRGRVVAGPLPAARPQPMACAVARRIQPAIASPPCARGERAE